MVARAVDAGRLERAPASSSARASPTRRARSRARRRLREQAARQGRARQLLAQRLHPAHQPVPRSLRLLHLREAARRSRREDLHARRGRRGDTRRRTRGLHRGALLSRRQAGDRLSRAPRVAGAARAAHHRRVPGAGLRGRVRDRHAPAHQRRDPAARGDGAAARRERVARADARDDEPAPAREGRRALLGARQGARRAHPHARGSRRARDPVHERHAARHRRDERRARRHAARDPRARRSLRSHPGSHRPAVPSEARHAHARRPVARRRRGRRLGGDRAAACSAPR